MVHSEQAVDDGYHEAAHAVFSHRARVEIVELRVGGEGKIETQWPTDPLPEQALDIAAGCLAGLLSVGVMRGQGFKPMTFDEFLEVADFAESTSRLMGDVGIPIDPEDLRAIIPDQIGDDYEDALAMLAIAQPVCGDLEQCYRVVIDRLKQGFEDWWEEIDTVANALLQNGRLSGHETVEIIESVGQDDDG